MEAIRCDVCGAYGEVPHRYPVDHNQYRSAARAWELPEGWVLIDVWLPRKWNVTSDVSGVSIEACSSACANAGLSRVYNGMMPDGREYPPPEIQPTTRG